MSPIEELKDIVTEGIALDIFDAEESLAFLDSIGTNADEINKATFGAFFGTLQRYLNRQLVLSVSRLFEEPKKRYRIRSLRTAINVLENNAAAIVIPEKPNLIVALKALGAYTEGMEKATDEEITLEVVDFFSAKFPKANQESIAALDVALYATKTIRDKNIAHSEAVSWDELPKPTYVQLEHLVEIAKEFVGTVGLGYTSTVYSSNDPREYYLSDDAKRSTRCLNRMFKKLGIG